MNIKKLSSSILILIIIASCSIKDPNNGVQQECYPNGYIKSETTLKNGLREGKSKHYDSMGRLLSETEYKNDLKNGVLINYDPETHRPILEATFKDDIQHGKVIQYYKEGMLFRESNYTKGRLDGKLVTFWPDGKIKAENFFSMGKPSVGLKEYDKAGNLLMQSELIIKRSSTRKNAIDISITGDYNEVQYYIGTLEDGKFFKPKSKKLNSESGKALYDYTANLSGKKVNINIIAVVKTEYGNTLVLQKSFIP